MIFMQTTTVALLAQGSVALTSPVSSWKVASSSKTNGNATELSIPGIDTSSWYTIGSKGTLMATLIENNVYNEHDLFYSTNLQNVDTTQFRVPWYYRSEGILSNESTANHYYTLKTNGISSRADIWLNGKLVADKKTQAGAYTGLEYDITEKIQSNGKDNVLLIKVYPTDYNRDFALGFVDWNPYPPDNGTGVWRDVELKRTGQVSISSPRVITHATLDGNIDIFLDIRNMDKKTGANGTINCVVLDPDSVAASTTTAGFDLKSGQEKMVSLPVKVNNPKIWWPRQWGDQPLYSVQCNASNFNTLSDTTPSVRFGIRTVTSTLNTVYNDTTFHVNGERFQVLGAGYTSDMFLRFNEDKLRAQFEYVLAMGLNTVRLEGKQEHPFLYSLASEMGIMLLAGWECCDKWEGWSYNDEGGGAKCMLGFLVGSDFWPDDRATAIYTSALKSKNWDTPIIASASKRGSPDALGSGGMRMEGPYDWVPPNYWFDPSGRLGSAAGFGSELGAGVGTPELGSLTRFLSKDDMSDLWQAPDKGLYHMSTNTSSFYTRSIYNDALWARYGKPASLEGYLLKAQMMDYEATRAQFEAYLSRWTAERPATGLVYWMLNNAWPALHWNLFDYYLHPQGAFFGVQTALKDIQTLVYDYQAEDVVFIDRRSAAHRKGTSTMHVDAQVLSLTGTVVWEKKLSVDTKGAEVKEIFDVGGVGKRNETVLLRLLLTPPTASSSTNNNSSTTPLSRKTYWIAPTLDKMDWDNSSWYSTPITSFSDLTDLSRVSPADVHITFDGKKVSLLNKSSVPAVFLRLNLVDKEGRDVVPVVWSENYVTIWPGESMDVNVRWGGGGAKEGVRVVLDGRNVEEKSAGMSSGEM
ncbi:Glycoside hydrolase family 2 protein [Pyrenophora teres f. teres]|uniref:Glycoside hydrolase family 2 protein n=1 Tax=Pyrenophora teres f. teres TaxID=97479 RepID=A0A6S6W566_9PLEO|nr:Glycoside hydrolase family 2 protein [Pyrenophora teres f. teres]